MAVGAQAAVGRASLAQGRRASTGGLLRRKSVVDAVARRLSAPDREFLRICLGGGRPRGSLGDRRRSKRSSKGAASECGLGDSSEGGFSSSSSAGSAGSRRSACSQSECKKTARTYFKIHRDSDEEEAAGSDADELVTDWGDLLQCNMYGEDSDDASDDDGLDLEQLFSFDIDRVSEAVRRGADMEELSKIIEDLMGDQLESRLAAESAGLAVIVPGETAPSMGDNLSGRMTPVLAECDGGDANCETPCAPSPDELSEHIGQAFAGRPKESRRRSSFMQHSRLSEAVHDVAERRRISLVLACEAAESSQKYHRRLSLEVVRRVALKDSRRHRASLHRAAEVLEAAGIGVDGAEDDEHRRERGESSPQQDAALCPQVRGSDDITQQLCLVQDAMKAARRRHRLSIAQAVQDVTESAEVEDADEQGPSLKRKLPCESLPNEKVQRIIARAYAEHREQQTVRAGGLGCSKQQGGLPAALVRSGTLVALMHARSGEHGKHNVHIGPPRTLEPGSSATRRRGHAAR